MTQEQLDTLTELWCLTAQESIGDYDLNVIDLESMPITYKVSITNKNIENIGLPYEYIRKNYTPKEKAKIVISLLEQIVENGDKWLQDEADYHGDKLAEKGDNDFKERLEND